MDRSLKINAKNLILLIIQELRLQAIHPELSTKYEVRSSSVYSIVNINEALKTKSV